MCCAGEGFVVVRKRVSYIDLLNVLTYGVLQAQASAAWQHEAQEAIVCCGVVWSGMLCASLYGMGWDGIGSDIVNGMYAGDDILLYYIMAYVDTTAYHFTLHHTTSHLITFRITYCHF